MTISFKCTVHKNLRKIDIGTCRKRENVIKIKSHKHTFACSNCSNLSLHIRYRGNRLIMIIIYLRLRNGLLKYKNIGTYIDRVEFSVLILDTSFKQQHSVVHSSLTRANIFIMRARYISKPV